MNFDDITKEMFVYSKITLANILQVPELEYCDEVSVLSTYWGLSLSL